MTFFLLIKGTPQYFKPMAGEGKQHKPNLKAL